MPYGGAQAMAPFFARLASLSPSQKAMAVHLGHFPNGGPARAAAPVDVSPDPGAMAMAMAGAPSAPAARPATTRSQPAASRRRPETRREAAADAIPAIAMGCAPTAGSCAAPNPRRRPRRNGSRRASRR